MSVAGISYEELSKKYPIANVPPFGMCIVVAGDEFDPDWEAYLEDCSCHFTDYEGKPVTLVQRKVRKDEGERLVFSPEESKKPKVSEAISKPELSKSTERHLVGWTKDDVERFIKLWNEDPNYAKILKSFPNRTKIALMQKATELKKAGAIENAYVVKSKLKKKEPLKPMPEVVIHPAGSPLFRRNEYVWLEKEEKRVIELWNAKKKVAEIQKELAKDNPERSEARSTKAICAEIQRLRERGLIKPRHEWRKKKKKMKEEKGQKEVQKPETQKETLDAPSSAEVERLLFVKGVGYCVRLPEDLCQKLGLKEKDFLIVQLEKEKGTVRLIPADIRPREK